MAPGRSSVSDGLLAKNDDQRYTVRQILDAFDELAALPGDPFRYPIYYLKPRS